MLHWDHENPVHIALRVVDGGSLAAAVTSMIDRAVKPLAIEAWQTGAPQAGRVVLDDGRSAQPSQPPCRQRSLHKQGFALGSSGRPGDTVFHLWMVLHSAFCCVPALERVGPEVHIGSWPPPLGLLTYT